MGTLLYCVFLQTANKSQERTRLCQVVGHGLTLMLSTLQLVEFQLDIYTVCPTRYRTRHFFNNSNTNEDIAKKFEQGYVWWPLPAHIMMSSHFLHNEVSPLQVSLQYPH